MLVVRSLQWCGARRARGRACHQPQTGAEYGEDGTVGDHGGDHQHANREEHQGPEQGVTAQRYREVGSAQPGAARSRKSSPSVMTNAITAARPTTTPHPNNRRLAPDGAAAPTGSARTASTAATRPAAVPSSTTWMPIIIQSAETGEARRSCPSTMLGPPLALHPLLRTSTCPPELGMGHGRCSCRTRRTRSCGGLRSWRGNGRTGCVRNVATTEPSNALVSGGDVPASGGRHGGLDRCAGRARSPLRELRGVLGGDHPTEGLDS